MKAPVLGGAKAKQVSLEESVFAAEVKPHLVHETVRAEMNAARAGHERRQEPRARRRRPLEAVAPEGHRARPRRDDARAAVDGRRHGVPAEQAQLRGEGQPEGPPRRAAGRALEPRRRTARSRSWTGPRSTRPRPAGQPSSSPTVAERPTLVVATEDEETRAEVVPQPREGARHGSGRARGRRRRLGALAARQRGGASGRARARGRRAGETEEEASE